MLIDLPLFHTVHFTTLARSAVGQGDMPPTAGHLTNSLGRDVTPERDLSSRDVTFDMDESLQYPLRYVCRLWGPLIRDRGGGGNRDIPQQPEICTELTYYWMQKFRVRHISPLFEKAHYD